MLLFVHVACYVEWLNLLSYFFNAHFKMHVLRGIKNILYLSPKKAKEIVYVMNGRSYFCVHQTRNRIVYPIHHNTDLFSQSAATKFINILTFVPL